MGWTQWREIADKNCWYDDEFDYKGPACHELGIGGPRGGNIETVYVGETKNERRKMQQYASHGSNLSDIIEDHLRRASPYFITLRLKTQRPWRSRLRTTF